MDETTDAPAARAYFGAWNRHEVGDILAAFIPDGTFWDTTMAEPVAVSSLEGAFRQTLEQFPDLQFVVGNVLDAGADFAVVEWRMQGTAGKDSRPRRIDVPGVDVFEIAGDRIRAARAYFNAQTMADQLA